MFVDFFYQLKDVGIPVSPTAFLTLQKALSNGLVATLDDFYTASRAILVKSERYFDLYDQVFAHHFQGAELPDYDGIELDDSHYILPGFIDCHAHYNVRLIKKRREEFSVVPIMACSSSLHIFSWYLSIFGAHRLPGATLVNAPCWMWLGKRSSSRKPVSSE